MVNKIEAEKCARKIFLMNKSPINQFLFKPIMNFLYYRYKNAYFPENFFSDQIFVYKLADRFCRTFIPKIVKFPLNNRKFFGVSIIRIQGIKMFLGFVFEFSSAFPPFFPYSYVNLLQSTNLAFFCIFVLMFFSHVRLGDVIYFGRYSPLISVGDFGKYFQLYGRSMVLIVDGIPRNRGAR